MKIYYFALTANLRATPSTRYRGKFILEELKRTRFVKYKMLCPDLSSFVKIFFILIKIWLKKDEKNVYIFQKISGRGKYSFLLRQIVKKTARNFYDIDDAVYVIRDKEVVDYFIKNCRGAIAASENLRKYCLAINSNTTLITTPLPPAKIVKKSRNKKFTLGWIGIYKLEHIENLKKLFFPILRKLNFDFKLILLGINTDHDEENLKEIFKTIPRAELEIIRGVHWENEDEINEIISRFDVGVMPLLDTEINRSKSAFKLKQYLNCGVPALVSDVGDNKLFIREGKTGFLCRNEKDWLDKLKFFRDLDEKEYRIFIQNCLADYQNGGYNLKKAADKFYAFISR